MNQQGEWEKGFYSGVLAALAVVNELGTGVAYRTIVNCVDARKLVRAARSSEYDLTHLRNQGFVTKAGNLKRDSQK